MKICVLHRYPLEQVAMTNPALIVFLHIAAKRKHKLYYIGFLQLNRKNKFMLLMKSLWFTFATMIKVWYMDKKNNFDLFYCDDSFPLYPLILKRLTKKKVLMRRGDYMTEYMPWWCKGIMERLEWKMLKEVDGISAITQTYKDFLVSNGIDSKKITVVEDSIDFTLFYSTRSEPKEYFTVMFHGVDLPVKDFDTMLEAIDMVKRVKNITFIFLSNHKKADQWVPYDEVPLWIDTCDIGIVARKDTLANSLVVSTALLQYWAVERPVIAPRLKAIDDVVDEGINGFLYEPGNPYDLAKMILRAIERKDKLRHMGKSGRKKAKRTFDTSVIAEKIYEFVCS